MHSRAFICKYSYQNIDQSTLSRFWNWMALKFEKFCPFWILTFWVNLLVFSLIYFSFDSNSLQNMKIEAKKNYTLKPRVVLPDSYVKGKSEKLLYEFEHLKFTFQILYCFTHFRHCQCIWNKWPVQTVTFNGLETAVFFFFSFSLDTFVDCIRKEILWLQRILSRLMRISMPKDWRHERNGAAYMWRFFLCSHSVRWVPVCARNSVFTVLGTISDSHIPLTFRCRPIQNSMNSTQSQLSLRLKCKRFRQSESVQIKFQNILSHKYCLCNFSFLRRNVDCRIFWMTS